MKIKIDYLYGLGYFLDKKGVEFQSTLEENEVFVIEVESPEHAFSLGVEFSKFLYETGVKSISNN